MFQSITTKLAGVTFGSCQTNIEKWGCPDIGSYAVVRESGNLHDPNAVRVSLFGIHDMGYLPKSVAHVVAPLMDDGRTFLALFIRTNIAPGFSSISGLTVRIVETTDQ